MIYVAKDKLPLSLGEEEEEGEEGEEGEGEGKEGSTEMVLGEIRTKLSINLAKD